MSDFFNSLGGYRPLGGNLPPVSATGFENLPFGDNSLVAAFGPPVLQSLMGGSGMSPFGFSGQNAYSTMLARQYESQQGKLMAEMAAREQANYFRTLQGMAALSGTPFGHEQRLAAQNISSVFASASPVLAALAPDLLDQLSGSRGSSLVMANQFMAGSRYRLDPTTGSIGMSFESTRSMTDSIYRDLFQDSNIANMRGITAGQLGGLYQEMQSRGMISASPLSVRDRGRSVLEDMRLNDTGGLRELAMRNNVSLENLQAGDVSGATLDRLIEDNSISTRLQADDTSRVKKSLQGYIDSIAAVRDIFGDAGNPNAPMQQLVAGLERLTQGSLGQMDPGRLASMVRMTGELSQLTGTSLDTVMAMQNHAANRANQLGLSPAFAAQATQEALAFGGALRGAGYGASTSFGLMGVDEMQQADLNLRLQAADSSAANQMAVALRLEDQTGGFNANSDAARYVAALKDGQSTFMDRQGQVRSVDLTRSEFDQVLGTGGRGITPQLLSDLRSQKFANQAYVESGRLGGIVRELQTESDFKPFVRRRIEETMRSRLTGLGLDDETAAETAASIGVKVADDIFSLDQATVADPRLFSEAISDSLSRRTKETDAGVPITEIIASAGQTDDDFYGTSAVSFQGYATKVLRRTPGLRQLKSVNNLVRLNQSALFDSSSRVFTQARVRANLKSSMDSIGSGGPLRAVVDAVSRTDPGDPDSLKRIIASAFGGIDKAEVNERILPGLENLRKLEAQYKQAAADLDRAESGPERQAAIQRLNGLEAEIKAQAQEIRQVSDELGFGGDQAMNRGDFESAINASSSLENLLSEYEGLSPEEQRARVKTGEIADTADTAFSQSESLALKVLLSDKAAERLGLGGLEQASKLRDVNAELVQLAAQYAGGDMDKLIRGEMTGQPAQQQRVKELLRSRTSLAAELQNNYDSGRKIPATASVRERLGIKLLTTQEELDQQMPTLIDRYRQRLNLSPQDVATGLADSFGFKLDDASQRRLMETLSSEEGLVLGGSILEDRGRMKEIAEARLGASSNPNESLDKMSQDYQNLYPGTFKTKYGVDADEYQFIGDRVRRHSALGLDKLGQASEFGTDRIYLDGSRAADMFEKAVGSGGAREEEIKTVRLDGDTLTIRGYLDIGGEMEARVVDVGKNDVRNAN